MHAGSTGFDVALELNGLKKRLVHSLRHGMEHPPMGRRFLRFASAQNGIQSLALLRIGALVNNHLHFAIAFEYRSRPGINDGCSQAGEVCFPEVSAGNIQRLEAAAVALVWSRFELTGTAPVTITIAEIDTFHIPVYEGHLAFLRGRQAARKELLTI